MARFFRRLGLVLLIGLAGFGGCVYNRITNLGYDSITDDAFMIDGFGSNVGVLRTDAGTVLVDSMTFPMQGKRIRALAEELTGQPVRIVISTHYHLDHTHGNPAFDSETEFVSTARTLANLRTRDGAFWEGENADKLPETTFDHEHEIKLGGKTIRLIHPGRGHTDGDAVVLFVEDRVLHTGDLFVHDMYPNIDLEGGGSIERWIETLDRVAALDFDSAIPGHGLLGDVKAIREFQQYLRDLWRVGTSAAERGASLEQTLDSADLSAYSHFQVLSVPFVLRLDRDFNVTRAWEEATGNFTYVPAEIGAAELGRQRVRSASSLDRFAGPLDRFAVVAAVALAIALQAFFFHRGLYAIGWDEAGRTLDAWGWANGGPIVGDWLPLYRMIVGSALRLYPDLVVTPRLVSGAFGVGAVLAVGWLAHELFRDRRTTTLTLFLAAAFSQRVALSVTPLSCILFAPLIVTSLAALANWIRSDRLAPLALSIGCLWAAQALRFEGWLFAAFFVATVFLHRRTVDASTLRALAWSFGVALALSLVPLAWALERILDGVAVFSPVETVRGETPPDLVMRNPFVQFVLRNGRSLNLIGVVAFGFLLRGTERRFVAYFALAAYGPLIALSSAMLLGGAAQTGPSWRMTVAWGLLLLPFTATVLTRGWRGGRRSATARRASAFAAALLIVVSIADTERIRRESTWAFPPSDRELGAVIEDLVRRNPTARVLVDTSDFSYLNVLVASQHPEAFVLNEGPTSVPRASILQREPGLTGSVCDDGSDLLLFHPKGDWSWLAGRDETRAIGRFGNWAAYLCEGRT